MASLPLHTSELAESDYSDAREPSRYHTDLRCPIGRWIPIESLQRGRPTNAIECESCAATDGVQTTFLFAI